MSLAVVRSHSDFREGMKLHCAPGNTESGWRRKNYVSIPQGSVTPYLEISHTSCSTVEQTHVWQTQHSEDQERGQHGQTIVHVHWRLLQLQTGEDPSEGDEGSRQLHQVYETEHAVTQPTAEVLER